MRMRSSFSRIATSVRPNGARTIATVAASAAANSASASR